MKKMNYMYKLCGTALAVLFSVSVSDIIIHTNLHSAYGRTNRIMKQTRVSSRAKIGLIDF